MESARIHLRAAQGEDVISGASAGTARRNMSATKNKSDTAGGG